MINEVENSCLCQIGHRQRISKEIFELRLKGGGEMNHLSMEGTGFYENATMRTKTLDCVKS